MRDGGQADAGAYGQAGGGQVKLPLWAQVQVERALDELKPGQIVIHTDGTSVRMVVPQLQYKEPKDQRPGHLEF